MPQEPTQVQEESYLAKHVYNLGKANGLFVVSRLTESKTIVVKDVNGVPTLVVALTKPFYLGVDGVGIIHFRMFRGREFMAFGQARMCELKASELRVIETDIDEVVMSLD